MVLVLKQRWLLCVLGLLVFTFESFAVVRYVNLSSEGIVDGASWNTAFRKIQPAIDAAVTGDEIWVAAGTYRECLGVKPGVELLGGFAGTETQRSQRNWNLHSTVIDSGLTNRAITMTSPATARTRLDGFVIRSGSANYGGAIYSAGGDFIIANNVIVNNRCVGAAGGAAVYIDRTSVIDTEPTLILFTNLANYLLQDYSTTLSVSYIPLYPANDYSREVHRRLQVAANIVDAAFNNSAESQYPLVFRPVFSKTESNVVISGFVEENDAAFVTNRWLDLASSSDRALLEDNLTGSNVNVVGQAIVLSAKKGLPNFNELSWETIAELARHLELRKPALNASPNMTNQMFTLTITNIFGVEAWNSYTQNFTGPLDIQVELTHSAAVKDASGAILWPVNGMIETTWRSNMSVTNWSKATASGLLNQNSFLLPLRTNAVFMPRAKYVQSGGLGFVPIVNPLTFESPSGFPIPEWHLEQTIRFGYISIENNRIVDFVNLGVLTNRMTLTPYSMAEPFPAMNQLWSTNLLSGSVPIGVVQQIDVSLGHILFGDDMWFDYNALEFPNKAQAISAFHYFVYGPYQSAPPTLTMQAPFAPFRKVFKSVRWQANDPLVHFTSADLAPSEVFSLISPPRSPTPPSNLQTLNDRYEPWGGKRIPGGHPFGTSSDANNSSIKDINIRWSDDWRFASGTMVNLAWLDSIHRGTDWQTLYTGAAVAGSYAFDARMHPTNDWRLLDLLTTNRILLNASPLSVNAPVLVNNTFAGNTSARQRGSLLFNGPAILMNNIVSGNSSGIFSLPVTNDVAMQNNCIFGNAGFDRANLEASEGYISAVPQFAGATGNYRLLATSPCIDQGSNLAFNWLHGDEAHRLQGGAIDIGAFELHPSDAPVFAVWEGEAGFEYHLTGYSGQTYVIEASDDLLQWTSIATNVTISGQLLIHDPTPGTNRFYRAIHQP